MRNYVNVNELLTKHTRNTNQKFMSTQSKKEISTKLNASDFPHMENKVATH